MVPPMLSMSYWIASTHYLLGWTVCQGPASQREREFPDLERREIRGTRASAAPSDDVMYDNLRSVCGNYAALGVERFLVARALENGAQL